MRKNISKLIATGLICTTVITGSNIEADACDAAAVMETTKTVSASAGPFAPVVLATGLIITGVTTVIGIVQHNHSQQTIYQSLSHLPDNWKPNSVVEKVKPNGIVIQRRFYGENGKPILDVDLTNHGMPEYHPFEHNGAHKHVYDYSKRKIRGAGQELTDDEYNKYVKEFDRSKAERMRVRQIED